VKILNTDEPEAPCVPEVIVLRLLVMARMLYGPTNVSLLDLSQLYCSYTENVCDVYTASLH
jgi:hypothetical protein